MTFGIVDIILLIGAAQGYLLAFFIIHKYRKKSAPRYLAILMSLISTILIELLFHDNGVYHTLPYLKYILSGLPFLVGPLYFLYARQLTHGEIKSGGHIWQHFIPYIIFKAVELPRFIDSKEKVIAYLHFLEKPGFSVTIILWNWAIIIHILSYIVATIFMLRRYNRNIMDIFSTIEQIKLAWLRTVSYLIIAAFAVFITEMIFYMFGINLSNYFTLSSAMGGVFLYSMGYFGLVKSEIFMDSDITSQLDQLKTGGNAKYEKSGLTSEDARKCIDRLKQLMESGRLYRDSSLTLTKLADLLNITSHNLSQALNTQLHQNFFDFINHYRVEQIKTDLIDPDKKNLTLLSLALDAGFNSKSSFNAIFKKHTGLTPSTFRKS